MLLTDKCADLLLQFLPKQKAQASLQHIDAARQIVEASLPRFVVGMIRQHLVPYLERMSFIRQERVAARC
jgi:hypothetical protein